MKKINKEIVPLKYLIKFNIIPSIEDTLYEIVEFLESENRMDGEFNLWEFANKIKTKINSSENDLEELIRLGYVEKLKYTKYLILKHLW